MAMVKAVLFKLLYKKQSFGIKLEIHSSSLNTVSSSGII